MQTHRACRFENNYTTAREACGLMRLECRRIVIFEPGLQGTRGNLSVIG